MLWRTGPAATELEERACDNDTASIVTFLALAAARERLPGLEVRARGLAGRPEVPALVVYTSDQAHSAADKSMIALGLGLENLRRLPCDADFRLEPEALAAAIRQDRAAGRLPMAVVATAGTTSATSVDPLRAVAAVARAEGLWLHVDAASGGSAAVCPEYRALLDGIELADSIMVNPHKWLFVPLDCSVLYVRDPDHLRAVFTLVPEFLRTGEQEVTNLMDLGLQLGRRFRALKLWMVIRAFGVEGLRARIREHCRLARSLASWIAADPDFELAAPAPFSTVCLRARFAGAGEDEDRKNQLLLDEVNASGRFFLSHTRLRDRLVLRVAIGNLRTTERHVTELWELLRATRDRVAAA